MDKTKIKQDKNAKNLNTSNTQSLIQYCQKQYLPQWSCHSVARHPHDIGWRFFDFD